jgi:hypothetical protein
MSHIQWIGGAWLLALAAATRGPRIELALVAAVCLTGPLVLFFLPLFIARWWIERETLPLLVVVTACAAVQLVTLALTNLRPEAAPPDLSLIPLVLVERIFHAPVPYALALMGIWLIATADSSWRLRALLGMVILAVPVAGLLQSHAPTAQYLDEVSGGRYFWLGTALAVAALLITRPRRTGPRWARQIALAAFALVFVTSARIPAFPTSGWDERSACIGGDIPCLVPVTPGGPWFVQWPYPTTP